MALTLVFVHGWSATNLDTYGQLPLRLKAEAALSGIDISVKEIFLGSYISFHDEVRVNDISRAFKNAVQSELYPLLEKGSRFICITHSTGGPVVRDWWNKYYKESDDVCPMSHLIMLAPANYGSALAQLGKGRLSRLKSWWNGVEPGVGVLNWLALGSKEAWELNKSWIESDGSAIGEKGIFPFVITGQDIDRKFYDHLNPYTGELGSDGVVRAAAANLEGRIIKLAQPTPVKNEKGILTTGDFQVVDEVKEGPESPFRVVHNKSHSGNEMGIMKSTKRAPAKDGSSETIKAIIDCIRVRSKDDYQKLYKQFAEETAQVQRDELVEVQDGGVFAQERYFIHDRFSMVIFRVHDHEGFPLTDFDLILTAGPESDPDHLPEGFCADRQKNALHHDMITYFFNYDVMKGAPPVFHNGKEIRAAHKGSEMLGLEIRPRPERGFVRYIPCRIKASVEMLEKALVPNSTTLIDICLQRVVDKQVFRSSRLTGDDMPGPDEGEFSGLIPGADFID
ncbi:MAG: phospholipase [Bacteroidota bacterium]|nr:phospholipase [Bacteroidota bacterium]